MTKTADVALATNIDPVWGNEIRDRTTQVFASVAERDAQWLNPPNGSVCVTLDTYTRWRRQAGAWVNVDPFIQSGATTGTTDGFGSINVVLPAYAKWVACTVVGTQTSYPALFILNTGNGAPGTSTLFVNCRHPDGTPWGNTTVGFSYICTYTR
jgi:hypothetical protein